MKNRCTSHRGFELNDMQNTDDFKTKATIWHLPYHDRHLRTLN